MSDESLMAMKVLLAALENLGQASPEHLQRQDHIVQGSAKFTESLADGNPISEKASGKQHLIEELGWTKEQAAAIRYRLAAFQEDWEAPGMELYDDL